jgi:hypothetical protein
MFHNKADLFASLLNQLMIDRVYKFLPSTHDKYPHVPVEENNIVKLINNQQIFN